MGRVYATVFENISVTVLQDYFEIAPADDRPCRLLSLHLSQISDTGDTEEEMLRIKVIRGHSTVGSGGGTDNETPIDPIDIAAGYVGGINNTTIAADGTPVDLYATAFNIRVGLDQIWTPETAPKVTQIEGTMVVRLMVAPNDELFMSGTMYVEEI